MCIDIDEVVISRFEYEQFRHALSFCNFIAALDTPIGAKTRPTITLTMLIDRANAVLNMKEENTEDPLAERMRTSRELEQQEIDEVDRQTAEGNS